MEEREEVPANIALRKLFQDTHCSLVSGHELLCLISKLVYLKAPFFSLSLR